jgi:hypothetical protein
MKYMEVTSKLKKYAAQINFGKSKNFNYALSLKTGKNIIFQPAHVSRGVHRKDLDIDI